MTELTNVAVVGAGAWGTALAQVVAREGRAVSLWAFEHDVADAINGGHENTVFLPGIPLSPSIRATSDLADLADADAVLLVVPAQHVRRVAGELAGRLRAGVPLLICAKGIEQRTGLLLSDVLAEVASNQMACVLSGPSFAGEAAKGLPTAVTLACPEAGIGEALLTAIGSLTFRPYLSDDVRGAQVGGAVKNVLAIACGIVEGKGFGASARAALTTRGFAELGRLAEKMGARRETLSGLSGLGDLILTCNSPQSRNMSLGMALGSGKTLAEVMAERKSVAEGVHTAAAVRTLAKEHGIDMPISEAVAAIVGGEVDVDTAIVELLSRPFKAEL